MAKTSAEVDEIHQRVVSRFVVRARRIQAHSIFHDAARLHSYVVGEMKLTVDGEGQIHRLRSLVPAEEQLESLAGRVRPLLLRGDGVYFANAIRSVQHFARAAGQAETVARLERTRDEFLAQTEGRGIASFAVQIQHGDDGEVAQMTDLQLAESWLYGDVVHADADHIRASAAFGVDERFRAAVGVYTRLAVNAVGVLRHVEQLRSAGSTVCGDDPFNVNVVATVVEGTSNYFKKDTVGRVRVAPVGTPPPPFGP